MFSLKNPIIWINGPLLAVFIASPIGEPAILNAMQFNLSPLSSFAINEKCFPSLPTVLKFMILTFLIATSGSIFSAPNGAIF